jgi:hypothetical protein
MHGNMNISFLCLVVTSGLLCPSVHLVPIAFRQYPWLKMAYIAEDFMCFRMECTMLSESSGLFYGFNSGSAEVALCDLWSRLWHGIDNNIATFSLSCSVESYRFLRG